ncbi:hypothetical protein CRE_12714 [Caenorhabditis remanei]|uniref:Uncharacterized protein n=1 Tax=Caenorhabditis remanei TaxID=31234 RepID=E3M7E3_CAERE|nr:hypothetical protein CRE_12714 [Caenorhabditis remanei]
MRRKRARSSNPNGCKTNQTTLTVGGRVENNNGKVLLPNSTSQPMLSTQSARGCNTLPRRDSIITANHCIHTYTLVSFPIVYVFAMSLSSSETTTPISKLKFILIHVVIEFKRFENHDDQSINNARNA